MDHFSITQLTSYLNCPAQYRYSYVERIPWEFKSADMVFGSVCHQTIANCHQNNCNLDEMVADFEKRWDKAVSETENLRFKKCDEKQLTIRGKRLMEIYYQMFNQVVADDIELFFELPMLDLATGQYAEQTIQGRIDLVSEAAVYEFKTSSKSYNQAQADESLQLTFYAWAYQYLYGKRIHQHQTNTKQCFQPLPAPLAGGRKEEVKMKIIFSTVDEMFSELKAKGIKEVRVETVATVRTNKRGIRWVTFELYVTAEMDGKVAQVVIIYHGGIEELIKQEGDKITFKEGKLIERCEQLAKLHNITLKDGAFWEGEPFRGAITLPEGE
ncbi:MAG: RecB family exonuclease, partial [Candidatus Poribacteria bacterium]